MTRAQALAERMTDDELRALLAQPHPDDAHMRNAASAEWERRLGVMGVTIALDAREWYRRGGA